MDVAAAMTSYTWGDKIKDVALALWLWAAGTGRDPETIHIWIYSLCINQWSLPADLALAFKSRVERIGLLLPLRTPFDRPAYVTRLCMRCTRRPALQRVAWK